MTAAGESVKAFIEAAGVGPNQTDRESFTRAFRREMVRGAARQGRSLAMIPTYLSAQGRLKPGDLAAAVDFGGTNFRAALVSIRAEGARLEEYSSRPSPGKDGAMRWEDFLAFTADCVRPLLRRTDKLGLCISFPTTITPEGDGLIHHFTKEIDITGYQGRAICRDLKETLGMPEAGFKAINDTTAVLLSALAAGAKADGLMGLIVGTGTNICCQMERRTLGLEGTGSMIVAMESGGFLSPDRTELDRLLDADTLSPGVYPEEKIVAGGYLGKLCSFALRAAAEKGLFSNEARCALRRAEEFITPQMDAFAAGSIKMDVFSEEADAETAREIVRAVFARAAKHIALSLAATADETLPRGGAMTVSADGSVFLKSAAFRKPFFSFMEEYCAGRKLDYVTMEHSTLIGTAIGALINAKGSEVL